MMFNIVCDCRETFVDKDKNAYNDHFSKKSINNIVNALIDLGYSSKHIGGINELIELCKTKEVLPDEYFINLSDGLSQKNRRLQAPILLEILGVHYSGSEPFAIALANDKATCKKLLSSSALFCVPKDVVIDRNQKINIEFIKELYYPVIVKPNAEGSSIGITPHSFIMSPEAVIDYYNSSEIHDFDSILVEEYVCGYEITSLIIGNNENHHVFPLLICYNSKTYFEKEIMDIEVKRSGQRKYVHPNKCLSNECVDKIINATIEVKKRIGLQDIARVDFRVTKDENIVFIEVNSNPVLSESSELGAICQIYDISQTQILDYYVKGFLSRVQN